MCHAPDQREVGSRCVYSCTSGYKLTGGTSTRTCVVSGDTASWDGLESSCTRKCLILTVQHTLYLYLEEKSPICKFNWKQGGYDYCKLTWTRENAQFNLSDIPPVSTQQNKKPVNYSVTYRVYILFVCVCVYVCVLHFVSFFTDPLTVAATGFNKGGEKVSKVRARNCVLGKFGTGFQGKK